MGCVQLWVMKYGLCSAVNIQKVTRIHMAYQVDEYTMKMQRRDLDNHLVEIKHSSGLDRWLVFRKTLDASHISLQVGI